MTHGPYNTVQRIVQPMAHGGWSCCTTHGSWRINFPWAMGCTMGMEKALPMTHVLYNSITTPSPTRCTKLYITHGPWIVQHYIYPMVHGLYNGSGIIHAP